MRTPEDQDCILIVDDDPDQSTLLGMVLGRAGFRVVAAGRAREGFDLARRERPDLIISDVVMPELSGIDLCRMIRAEEELRPIPILLLSAIDKRTNSEITSAGDQGRGGQKRVRREEKATAVPEVCHLHRYGTFQIGRPFRRSSIIYSSP